MSNKSLIENQLPPVSPSDCLGSLFFEKYINTPLQGTDWHSMKCSKYHTCTDMTYLVFSILTWYENRFWAITQLLEKKTKNNFWISSFWHQKVRWALITFQPRRGVINSNCLYTRDSSLQVPVRLTCQGQANWSVYYPKQIEHFNHFQSHFYNVHFFTLKEEFIKVKTDWKRGSEIICPIG